MLLQSQVVYPFNNCTCINQEPTHRTGPKVETPKAHKHTNRACQWVPQQSLFQQALAVLRCRLIHHVPLQHFLLCVQPHHTPYCVNVSSRDRVNTWAASYHFQGVAIEPLPTLLMKPQVALKTMKASAGPRCSMHLQASSAPHTSLPFLVQCCIKPKPSNQRDPRHCMRSQACCRP